MKAVLDASDPGWVEHKALDGLLDGMPLHGADLIRGWQQRAAQFPPLLAPRMVERIESSMHVLGADDAAAVAELEQLVAETLSLAAAHMPEADTTVLRRGPGERYAPWG